MGQYLHKGRTRRYVEEVVDVYHERFSPALSELRDLFTEMEAQADRDRQRNRSRGTRRDGGGEDEERCRRDSTEKRRDQMNRVEQRNRGFRCVNKECKAWIPIHDEMGTRNRNHCPCCLHSKHVDEKSGDRASECRSNMEPVALTWKVERKWEMSGSNETGDLMLVHCCKGCGFIRINRIAADDAGPAVLALLQSSYGMNETLRALLNEQRILPIDQNDEVLVRMQFE